MAEQRQPDQRSSSDPPESCVNRTPPLAQSTSECANGGCECGSGSVAVEVAAEADTQLNLTAHFATIGQLLCSRLTACNSHLVIRSESVSSDRIGLGWTELDRRAIHLATLIKSGVAFKYLKLPFACKQTHLSRSQMVHWEKAASTS